MAFATPEPVSSKHESPRAPVADGLPESRSSEGLPASGRVPAEAQAAQQGYINRGAAGYGSSDEALQQAVLEALLQQPIFEVGSMGVRAQAGVITLEGNVASTSDRAKAVQTAEAVPGVTHVRDRLSVQTATPAGTRS
jgi:osmotically-inducible protein OsmY